MARWKYRGPLGSSGSTGPLGVDGHTPVESERATSEVGGTSLTLVAIVLLPLLQPWTAIEPALEVTSSAIVSSAAPVHTLEAAQGGIGATSWPDPSLAIVAIVMAGVGLRLLWLFYGIIRLSRFSGHTPAVLPPAVAADFEAALGVSACYIQQTGSRGSVDFWISSADDRASRRIRCARPCIPARRHLS